jgi:hypothetical protein
MVKLADFPTSLSALFGGGRVAAVIKSSLVELGAPDSPSSTLPTSCRVVETFSPTMGDGRIVFSRHVARSVSAHHSDVHRRLAPRAVTS